MRASLFSLKIYHELTYKLTDRWTDRRMDRRTYRQTYGPMDGWTEINKHWGQTNVEVGHM
jgi:hypothetical protein